MKLIKNILKILVIVTLLFTTSIIKQPVFANTTPISSAYLYAKSSYANMIKYNGVEILTTFVVYSKDGVEYPAYCLDANMPGVGEKGSYTVNTDTYLNDVMLWRVVTNGYPYKTISELGCNTKEEAFTATKQAVYCMLYGREASWYTPIGAQGQRVINAMTKILQNARNSTSVKPSADITIQSQENKWSIDTINKNYVSQTFKIVSSSNSNNCQLSLSGNYPEGTKIVDSKNNNITNISSGSNFKVITPIKNLNSDGEFQIKVQATLTTKPVLYGKAPNSSWQDYAVTASVYEDASGSATINYKKNSTKITILKQDLETKKPVEGVTFQLLDSDKKVVYTDLISNNEGIIEITNLLPGRYYLEEVKTKEGYVKYEKQIECNISLNQTLTVTVNNSKSIVIEEQSNNQQINVEQNNAQITVGNSNTNINIQNNNHQIDINNENTNYNEVNTNTNINVNNENSNTNINNNNENINIQNQNINSNIQNLNGVVKLPKTGM